MEELQHRLAAFGRAVRRTRRDLELSQEALAMQAGVSITLVGELERGNRDPRLSTVLKLADALELDAAELFAISGDRLRGRPGGEAM